MSTSSLHWQRALGIIVAVVMVLALITPTIADAHQAPAPQKAGIIQGTGYTATFVGKTNGTALELAERAYGPDRAMESVVNGSGTVKEQIGNYRLPWAQPKRNTRLPWGSSSVAPQTDTKSTDEERKKIIDEPNPYTVWDWSGVNQGGNRTLFGFGFLPPDTNGDTSGDAYYYGYYVQTINTAFAVWDYTQTNVYLGWPKTVLGPIPVNSLWEGTGSVCEATNDGDPIVLYDENADRWLISQFALPIYDPYDYNGSDDPADWSYLYPDIYPYAFYECIAISQSSNPTGNYYLYEFAAPTTGIDHDFDPNTAVVPGSKMPDYPKFGIWQDGYYMTVNQFDEINGEWGGAGVYVFERDAMLTGAVADYIYLDPFYGANCSLSTYSSVESNPLCFLGGMLPADNDGAWANWGAGNYGYVMQFDDDAWSTPAYIIPDQLELWAIDVDWNSNFAIMWNEVNLPVSSFDSNMCNYQRACIPQPGTTAKLDSISDRLMNRLQFRQVNRMPFGGNAYEAMVTNHTVDVSGTDRAGIRWYELRRDWDNTNMLWGDWHVYQQGTYSPDTDSRWMASIAMDSVGNLALGYSVSSSSTYPDIRYTTHEVNDPLGTMRAETYLIPRSIARGSQLSSSSRWGDYSSMNVAPDDRISGLDQSCMFTYTNEYYRSLSGADFFTHIGTFGFDTCSYNDIEGPIMHWDVTPPVVDYYRYGEFEFYALDDTGVDHYMCKMDNGAWFTCSSPYEYNSLSTGIHTFSVYGVDDLGNSGEPISFVWEVTAATATYQSQGAVDGYMTESNELSNIGGSGSTASGYYIIVGDQNADKQVKGLLSFTTNLPPGAVITNVRIGMRLASTVGTNPYNTHGNMFVDMNLPYFGATSNLAANDFEAVAYEVDAAACSSVAISNWYTCDMYNPGNIPSNGMVQFRLYFGSDDNDDGYADLIRFFSGNYATVSYRPYLMIDYYIP